MKLKVMILLVFLAILPLASSSIFIEPLKTVYNYGDQINVQTKIVPPVATSSHYIVDLKCGTTVSYNIFNSFFDLSGGIEKQVLVTTEVLNPLLENITGLCYLKASFGNEVAESSKFTLSKEIIVRAELESDNLKPAESFYLTGTAIKKSGAVVNGFVELFIPSLNLYKSALVTNGVFELNLTLPADVKSGNHNFSVEVHNTDHNSKKINFGSYSSSFYIGQILKEVKIYVATESVQPDSEFTFRIDAIDQAGDLVEKDVSLIVNKPRGVPFIKKVIRSGEDQKITFLLNETPGYWSIETDVDGIINRKLFYLSEVSTLQTSLINNTLIATNIGNSPYWGPLEITIGSVVEVKQIKLGPGETQKFTLRAPDGNYDISVLESGQVMELGSAFLTGNAVKVTDFREDVIYTFTNPWIWWLGIILLILVIVLVQLKVRMNRFPHSNKAAPVASNTMNTMNNPIMPTKKDFAPTSPVFSKEQPVGKKFDLSWLASSKTAIPSQQGPQKVSPASLFGTQNQGIRERAIAIAIHVSANNPGAIETTNRALHIAQEVGAKIYVDGEYKIVLFSPRLTKMQDNEINAINVARRMQALFLEHSRMYRDGVIFGLGIGDGEIISEIEGNRFHFTSTGNLISYAKRLAHVSNANLLISDSLRRKIISTVRTEKAQYQGVWEVVKVADRPSTPSEFLKKFNERNKK